MAHWTEKRTTAHGDLKKALKVVDDILSFVKEGKGKPSKKERALFAAAIVFAYGVWENYVEQLAIELVRELAPKLNPASVPGRIKRSLEKCSAWELTVSPGWRQLWIKKIEEKAVGDDGDKYGLNTAKAGQVQDLLDMAGVQSALGLVQLALVLLELLAGEVLGALGNLGTSGQGVLDILLGHRLGQLVGLKWIGMLADEPVLVEAARLDRSSSIIATTSLKTVPTVRSRIQR